MFRAIRKWRQARVLKGAAVPDELWREAVELLAFLDLYNAEEMTRLRDKAGRQYQLNGVTTRIGRLDDNDIVLDDTEVSRHHAVIIDTGTDFLITDMKSTNGVQVRGRRVHRSATLADGDHIRVGNSEFVFEILAG